LDAKLHISVTVPSGGPFSFDIVITNIYGSVLKSADLETLFEDAIKSSFNNVFSANQVSLTKTVHEDNPTDSKVGVKQRGRPRKVN
jgi:hypothetical protein